MVLQKIVPLKTEQEPRMCLLSVQAQPKCESAELESQQKQGKEGRPILGGRGRLANIGPWDSFILCAVCEH